VFTNSSTPYEPDHALRLLVQSHEVSQRRLELLNKRMGVLLEALEDVSQGHDRPGGSEVLQTSGQMPLRRRGAWEGDRIGTLSDRELEVLELVASGWTNREIAARLYLSPRTIDRHVSRIFGKLGVASRAAAASAFERARRSEGQSGEVPRRTRLATASF
jgi:DNA-binding NarL/FixJ family response regulator